MTTAIRDHAQSDSKNLTSFLLLRLSQENPARKHRDEHVVLEHKVMKKRGEPVKTREPEDRIAEPGVYPRNRCARIVRNSEERWNLHSSEERQGMPFEPCSGDGCRWVRNKKQVEHPLHGL